MAKKSTFVDTPMKGFMPKPTAGNKFKGGPGGYNGEKQGPFGQYPRTGSPNAATEKTFEGGKFKKDRS